MYICKNTYYLLLYTIIGMYQYEHDRTAQGRDTSKSGGNCTSASRNPTTPSQPETYIHHRNTIITTI